MRYLSLFWHSVEPNTVVKKYTDIQNSSASMFRKQLEFIREQFMPVPAREFIRLIKGKTSFRSYDKPPVLLGFDDGFRNVIWQALPILVEVQIPAVFFVLGECLENPGFVPWYVGLAHLIRKTTERELRFKNMSLDLIIEGDRRVLHQVVENSIKRCRSDSEREGVMEEVAALLRVERPSASELDEDLRLVSRSDLAQLEREGLLAVGSHAMTHRHLGSLNYREQIEELERSDGLLRRYCAAYYPVVSYPGGSHNADTLEIAKRIYKAGFSIFLGSSYRNIYAYPRIGVDGVSSEELAYKVSRIRLGCLLPVKRFLCRMGLERGKLFVRHRCR